MYYLIQKKYERIRNCRINKKKKFLELIYNNASIYLNRKYNSALSVRNDRVINRAKSVKAETLIPS